MNPQIGYDPRSSQYAPHGRNTHDTAYRIVHLVCGGSAIVRLPTCPSFHGAKVAFSAARERGPMARQAFAQLYSPSLEAGIPLTAPLQFNLFSGEAEPLPVEVPDPRVARELRIDDGITLVKSDDSSQLILAGYGLFLGKKSERLLVRKGKDVVYQFPMFRLHEVVVASRGVSLSADLVEELCTRGVRLSFLDSTGKPYALITSPMLTATVQARRAQILAFEDERGVGLARAVVSGKLKNQERLLRYFGKYLKHTDNERFASVARVASTLRNLANRARQVEGPRVDAVRGTLLGLEGTGGREYWNAVRVLLAARVDFEGRERRGATDAVNAALNYGYGILYSHVWGAVLNAGLEPFAGFLHVRDVPDTLLCAADTASDHPDEEGTLTLSLSRK